jgi:thymidylate synthase (FAD)
MRDRAARISITARITRKSNVRQESPMEIVKPSIEFLWMTEKPLQAIERAGRTCYKSEDRITRDSAAAFVSMLLNRGHEAMIEHASMSYRVVCDRGVTHEIVRHRLFSFAQESTRYCNYEKSGGIQVICPPLTDFSDDIQDWHEAVEQCERAYCNMIARGVKPEIARSVLPNCLKTEIVITGNFREWRHFFRLRTDKAAHPQMREVAEEILADVSSMVAVVFDDFRREACPTK